MVAKRKVIEGDGHALFHVGNTLPEEGSDFVLVPGKQDAQGRGVYCSDIPRLKYSGGEGTKYVLDITPIFVIPCIGRWMQRYNKKKDETTFHTDQQLLFLHGLHTIDTIVDGYTIRYYIPNEIRIVPEIDVMINGRHTSAPFSEKIINGQISPTEALQYLKERDDYVECIIDKKQITDSFETAIREGKVIGELHVKPKEAVQELRSYRKIA